MREQLVIQLARDIHALTMQVRTIKGRMDQYEQQIHGLQKAASVVYAHRKPGQEDDLFRALNHFEVALVTSQSKGFLSEKDTQRLVRTVQMIRDKEQ